MTCIRAICSFDKKPHGQTKEKKTSSNLNSFLFMSFRCLYIYATVWRHFCMTLLDATTFGGYSKYTNWHSNSNFYLYIHLYIYNIYLRDLYRCKQNIHFLSISSNPASYLGLRFSSICLDLYHSLVFSCEKINGIRNRRSHKQIT